ncbi:three-helix bundle dimerization domain-containing protein [Actinomycetospora straminea]|uniref:Uncharacterized protein n=1 Tax=Actinomycetospora straminea TaxID=663607 RepID=A0ABP9ECB5_9PSEU|nr:hypothetical protein [Actinomycetospora straminea]MDD7932132.1 hypothetical protein [Actinomycetospora straminea]
MTTTVDASGTGTTTTTSPAPDALGDTEARLVDRYTRAGVPAEHVHLLVADARERLAGARVSAFLPILVERSVRRALAA